MNKQPIPITTLCSDCPKYNRCTSLCSHAEQYVNQDSVSQRETILADMESTFTMTNADYKDVLHTRMRHIERDNKISKTERAIVSMHLGGLSQRDIMKLLRYSSQRSVSRIVSKYSK